MNLQIGDIVYPRIDKYEKQQWLNGYKATVIGFARKNVKIKVREYPDEVFYPETEVRILPPLQVGDELPKSPSIFS